MAQEITTICDVCSSRGQRTEAEETVVVTVNRRAIEADLCVDCNNDLNNGLTYLFQVGRRPETLQLRIPTTGKRGKPQVGGEFACDVAGCEKSFPTLQGLSMHNTRAHGNGQGATRRHTVNPSTHNGSTPIPQLKANRTDLPDGMTKVEANELIDQGFCPFDIDHGPFKGRMNIGSHLRQAHQASFTSLGLSTAVWSKNLNLEDA